jgi:hypothetical protein
MVSLTYHILQHYSDKIKALQILPDSAYQAQTLEISKKVHKGQQSILINGNPAATIREHEVGLHFTRQTVVQVAPGMDLTLAAGVAFAHYLVQKMDDKDEENAAAEVLSAVLG